MARTKQKRWSYITGAKGRTRVRAYERENGVLMLEWRERGCRKRLRLDHKDRDRAERQADAAKARLAEAGPLDAEDAHELTLGELFDMYEEEVTPTKAPNTQKHDRRTMAMFRLYFGADRIVTALSVRDWDRFIRDRRAGTVAPGRSGDKGSAGNRIIEQDLRLLLAVLNWATLACDEDGRVLLERNPLRGLKPPREKNPRRIVLTEDEYVALLAVSEEVDWRFQVALVLAHETGHRIGAISNLRWSDVDLEGEVITWRGEHEKTGYEHVTPMTVDARKALDFARAKRPGLGEAYLLPAPKDASKGVSRHLMRDWWKRAEALAKLPPRPGRGWHSIRRQFASELMHVPLKALCQLGGWKSPQTVLTCYQHPDQDQLKAALKSRGVAGE